MVVITALVRHASSMGDPSSDRIFCPRHTPAPRSLLRPQNPSPRPRTQSLEQLQWQRWRKRQAEEKDINQALAQTSGSNQTLRACVLGRLSLSFTCSLQPLDTTSIRGECVYSLAVSLSLSFSLSDTDINISSSRVTDS